jgi:ABC-2 type transport system ATP-binding protein
MQPSLSVEGLAKRYGHVLAVDDLTFDVRPGVVTGLVGPNGSGKSTTMRCALGLVQPTAGGVVVDGTRYVELASPLNHVGALLDADAVQGDLSGRDHLRWLAASNRVPARRADELIEAVGLSGAARRSAGGYSLGMRQRLGIAAALLGDPPILLFDEPMNGLDPDGMLWLRRLLRERASEGRIVLLSSHLMNELRDLADRLVVIDRGRLRADMTVDELLASVQDVRTVVHTHQRTEVMAALAGARATVTATGANTVEVDGLAPERIVEIVARHGLAMHGLDAGGSSLESAYLRLVSERRP